MVERTNRIRVAVGDLELELEGDQEFIARYAEVVDALLGALRTRPAERRADVGKPARAPKAGDLTIGEFGEQLGGFPKAATATDQVLLAGRFAQLASDDNTFATKDANALLLEQSVKVGNPSQCMTNNLKAKRVFKVGDRYRVSKPGEEHLASLLSA